MLQWVPLALRPHFHLGWNLFLALVPLILALWLFRPAAKRNWLWWPVFVAFLVFLPNAAYTLSDIIHFVAEVRDDNPELPTWSVIYILIPKYAIFIFIGFQVPRSFAHQSWLLSSLAGAPQLGPSGRNSPQSPLRHWRLLGPLGTLQ